VTVDKQNQDEVPVLMEYLKSIFPSNVLYYASRTRYEAPTSTFPREYYFTSKEFADFIVKHPSYMNLLFYAYGCGASNPMSYVIGPGGELYRCWHEMGQKDKAVGNVVDGITNWDRYNRFMSYSAYMLSDKCKQCDVVALCFGGGCPYRLAYPDETYDKELCYPVKYYLDDILIQQVMLGNNIVRVGFPNPQNVDDNTQGGN